MVRNGRVKSILNTSWSEGAKIEDRLILLCDKEKRGRGQKVLSFMDDPDDFLGMISRVFQCLNPPFVTQ